MDEASLGRKTVQESDPKTVVQNVRKMRAQVPGLTRRMGANEESQVELVVFVDRNTGEIIDKLTEEDSPEYPSVTFTLYKQLNLPILRIDDARGLSRKAKLNLEESVTAFNFEAGPFGRKIDPVTEKRVTGKRLFE